MHPQTEWCPLSKLTQRMKNVHFHVKVLGGHTTGNKDRSAQLRLFTRPSKTEQWIINHEKLQGSDLTLVLPVRAHGRQVASHTTPKWI